MSVVERGKFCSTVLLGQRVELCQPRKLDGNYLLKKHLYESCRNIGNHFEWRQISVRQFSLPSLFLICEVMSPAQEKTRSLCTEVA